MNDIIFIALQEEAPAFAAYKNVVFTGVGKVNASAIAAETIERYQPKRVFNFGTQVGLLLVLDCIV